MKRLIGFSRLAALMFAMTLAMGCSSNPLRKRFILPSMVIRLPPREVWMAWRYLSVEPTIAATISLPSRCHATTVSRATPYRLARLRLTKGNSYIFSSGATVRGGSVFCGYVTDATVSGGSSLAMLTLSSMIATSNFNGGVFATMGGSL